MKRLLPIAAALAILSAQGCSGLNWTKPGADANTISRDLDDCRAVALGRATPPVAPAGSSEATTDGGRPGAMRPAAGSNERFVAEHEEVRRCMLKRGYELK
jgi:hypothetical protein